MRNRLEEMLGFVSRMTKELEDIKHRLYHHGYSDKQIIDTSRRLGTIHSSLSSIAHGLAAQQVFINKNPRYMHPEPDIALSEIDLHGLRVPEAKKRVIKHLELCKIHHLNKTEIICGSAWNRGTGPRMKNALIALFRGTGVDYTEQANAGRLTVRFNSMNT